MALPTFTWLPSFELSLAEQPDVRHVPLGDGFSDYTPVGLRPRNRSWSLRFDTRTRAEVQEILDFLRERGGYRGFRWTPPPPDEIPGIWLAQSWNIRQRNGVVYGIDAVFQEQ